MEEITKQTERKINETADRMREGVDRARRQGTEVADRVLPTADEMIEKAKARGEAIWEKSKAKGQDLLDEVESNGQQLLNQTTNFVRKRPLQALGYAALAGLIIGALSEDENKDRTRMKLSESPPSIPRALFGLAKDHWDLAKLEWEFGKNEWRRRLLIRGGGVAFCFCAFLFFNLAIVGGLWRAGLSLTGIGLSMGFIYLAIGFILIKYFGKFEEGGYAENPLRETRSELKRSFEWIEKHFF